MTTTYTKGVPAIAHLFGSEFPASLQFDSSFGGRIIMPADFSLCGDWLGISSMAKHMASISTVISNLMAGLDTLIMNPLAEAFAAVQAAVTLANAAVDAARAYANGIIGGIQQTISTAMNTALTELKAGIAAASAAASAIMSHVTSMITDGLSEIMATLGMCMPAITIPSITVYNVDNLCSSLFKAPDLTTLTGHLGGISGILGNTGTSELSKITAMTGVKGLMSTSSGILTSAVALDVSSLAASKVQDTALRTVMQVATGLNSPTSLPFVTAIIHPASREMVTDIASTLKNSTTGSAVTLPPLSGPGIP